MSLLPRLPSAAAEVFAGQGKLAMDLEIRAAPLDRALLAAMAAEGR